MRQAASSFSHSHARRIMTVRHPSGMSHMRRRVAVRMGGYEDAYAQIRANRLAKKAAKDAVRWSSSQRFSC